MSIVGILRPMGADEPFRRMVQLSETSRREKMLIDNWIRDKELTIYGDPIATTVYPPNFDPTVHPKTGQVVCDRYNFLIKKFSPHRPWDTITTVITTTQIVESTRRDESEA